MWRRYRDLYAGGEQFRLNAAEYLLRAPEGAARGLSGTAGPGVLRELPGIDRRLVCGDADAAGAGSRICRRERTRRSSSLARFVQNCDLRGTTLTQFFKQQMTEALVCGKSYVVVDFPRTDGPALTRADEDALGA